MSRASIATPCPAPYLQSSLPIPIANRRLSATSSASQQDETVELEYTRALQPGIQHAKPRRKSTFHKKEKRLAPITIFEDVIEDEELVVRDRVEIGGHTLLGRPAQKLSRNAPNREDASGEVARHDAPLGLDKPRRRTSIIHGASRLEEDQENTLRLQETVRGRNFESDELAKAEAKGALKKEPRRRTIFVPTEDTTMLTIHPGADTTGRLDDTFQSTNQAPRQSILPEQQIGARQTSKRMRMSLAGPAKRIPLSQVPAIEANGLSNAVAGSNGGKENIPPHASKHTQSKRVAEQPKPHVNRQSMTGSRLFQPTAASQARQTVFTRNAVPLPTKTKAVERAPPVQLRVSPRTRNDAVDPRAASRSSLAHGVNLRQVLEGAGCEKSGQNPPKARLMARERRLELKHSRLQQYPVLSENLAEPELYDDSWLAHQEVAMSELVNHIFDTAQPRSRNHLQAKSDLRQRMLGIYHQPQMSQLYRRLKASLLYGALSRPRDLSSAPDPASDIGLRRKFLGLWLESYNIRALLVAAEVIFGRQVSKSDRHSPSISGNTLDPYRSRRALIGFLEAFLVDMDDIEDPQEDRGNDPDSRWSKLVLRSLMIIWLLDRAKTLGASDGCLFKPRSPRKTSTAMLHALSGMMIPSIGDITRVLRHLDYEVAHVQDPLDEVDYRIKNIAVDLRDGILLTRLVEILLFSSDRVRSADLDVNATVTIHMPDLTILESALPARNDAGPPRTLSQHLKMPSQGRAQKLYNVQIAISALREYGRLGQGSPDIDADDIVDGHRERTLSMLWSLVSTNSLNYLIDFDELAADTSLAAGPSVSTYLNRLDLDRLSQDEQESLLQNWATVYAERADIRVSNLTTSFADGRVYVAILRSFSAYIQVQSGTHTPVLPESTDLTTLLDALGCSTAFTKQLTTRGTIPSRRTTISNLAFLASRLLPLSRQYHAACTIQRAVRCRQARATASRRIVLMELANACAAVVQTRHRLVSAAEVLQRAWRRVLATRMSRLNADVGKFQATAKSWIVKRKLQHAKLGGTSCRSSFTARAW